jgi:hypothetical protein
MNPLPLSTTIVGFAFAPARRIPRFVFWSWTRRLAYRQGVPMWRNFMIVNGHRTAPPFPKHSFG